MTRLFVPDDVGKLILGGLLAVARADGLVCAEEMASLRATALELGLAMPAEEELLFDAEVTADGLAAALASSDGAYRTGGSTPDQIAEAFLEAALRLALADRELVVEEILALRELAAVLGVPTDRIAGWHAVSSDEPVAEG